MGVLVSSWSNRRCLCLLNVNIVPGALGHFEQYLIFRMAIAWMSNGFEFNMLEHDLSIWNTHVLSIGFSCPRRSRWRMLSRVHSSVHVAWALNVCGTDALTVSFTMYTEITCKSRGRAATGTMDLASHSSCGMLSGSMRVTMTCPPAAALIRSGMIMFSAQAACKPMSGRTAL